MKVEFLKIFSKDIDKIKRPKDRKTILEIISMVKSAESVEEISAMKKLTGFEDAFRIRSGDYRIGVFIKADTVIFARVAHRKDIYRFFP